MADIPADEVPLVNDALAMIGAASIFALDEETELADKVHAAWPRARNHCLAIHGWGFATRTLPFALEPATPENGWAYAFAFPGGVDGRLEVVLRDPKNAAALERNFQLEEGKLFADSKPLWGRFRVQAAAALWPSLFANSVVTLAAAYLAVPVSHDSTLAADLRAQAVGEDREAGKGGLLGRAVAEDMASRPLGSPLLRDDPLSLARFM